MPAMPWINPPKIPLKTMDLNPINDLKFHPLERRITRNKTITEITLRIICGSKVTTRYIPTGIKIIIEINNGKVAFFWLYFKAEGSKNNVLGISIIMWITKASVGEYIYANTGIVSKAGPNPKKPLSNPPTNITNIVINIKSIEGKFTEKKSKTL